MARTPLLRSLIELAREHRLARERNLPVEAIREEKALRSERRPSGVTRRQFLVGSAAAAAAMALPRGARAHGGGHGGPRIAIVGGGMAGMATALTLADAGVESTVYEASGRIGGRMFSNSSSYWKDGQASEWCGELIDTGHETIRTLSQRFGLPLVDVLKAQPKDSDDTFHFFGHYYPKEDVDRDFEAMEAALDADVNGADYPTLYNSNTPAGQALDAMSIYDWIETRVPGGHTSPLGMLLDVAYNIEYGAETTDQAALNLIYLLGYQPRRKGMAMYGESDERFKIVGGNQRLPVAIANSLGGDVETGKPLVAIVRKSDGRYTLTFGGGGGSNTATADIVVLTLPFAVLAGLDYSRAGFDGLKHQAIQSLGRGHNGKLQLQFSNRIWNGSGPWPGKSTGQAVSDRGFQVTWDVTRGQSGKSGILVNYTGGATTDGQSTTTAFAQGGNGGIQTDAQRFLTQVEPVFPGLSAQWNNKLTHSLPHLSPLFKCSYSYFRVGQYTTFAGYEKERQGNVFFAGEHCSTDFQGFMEGAASEGVRAGEEILADLGMAARPAAGRGRAA